MTHRFRLKVGPIEVEYEGDSVPDRKALLDLVELAMQSYVDKGLGTGGPAERPRIRGTTGGIAARLNCISGPELIVAAAARLTFVHDQEWFSADELLGEMKLATAHYDQSYESSLARDVKQLVTSGKLVEVAPGLFALSATMRRELQQALAE